MGNAERVLDGDLDGFVREYLVKSANAPAVGRQTGPPGSASPSSAASRRLVSPFTV